MLEYNAPVQDMLFLIEEVFQEDQFWATGPDPVNTLDLELVRGYLEECGRFSATELYPLNRTGDQIGVTLHEGNVTTPPGFKEAYQLWSCNGWIGLTGDPEYGGMGMPKTLGMFVGEMLFAVNASFALYPELTGGATYLIRHYADKAIKQAYLPKLYAGNWSSTMCLTESHCGSDLGLLKTQAERMDDGSYALSGEKIFISGGEHDMTDNIVHLVLARLTDAPEGVKGISLFLVPKFFMEEGKIEGNNVHCVGIEEKMGLHAAATCTMRFDQARGFLIGEINQGLSAMFSMMNYERLSIAMQGLGLGYQSYQVASSYAQDRIQGRDVLHPTARNSVPIIKHGDVKRMLLTMKSLNEGARALAFYTATQFDRVQFCKGEAQKRAFKLLSMMTPVVKAFITDMGFDICVTGQQILGGHGYVNDWGQEQLVRDARIASLYEGTNGIQALDLLARKVILDKGEGVDLFLADVDIFIQQSKERLAVIKTTLPLQSLQEAADILREVTRHILENAQRPELTHSIATEYLHVFGYVTYAYFWLKMGLAAQEWLFQNKESSANTLFYESKIHTCVFYCAKILPRIQGLKRIIEQQEDVVYTVPEAMF